VIHCHCINLSLSHVLVEQFAHAVRSVRVTPGLQNSVCLSVRFCHHMNHSSAVCQIIKLFVLNLARINPEDLVARKLAEPQTEMIIIDNVFRVSTNKKCVQGHACVTTGSPLWCHHQVLSL